VAQALPTVGTGWQVPQIAPLVGIAQKALAHWADAKHVAPAPSCPAVTAQAVGGLFE
jgi:hypothetical protein